MNLNPNPTENPETGVVLNVLFERIGTDTPTTIEGAAAVVSEGTEIPFKGAKEDMEEMAKDPDCPLRDVLPSTKQRMHKGRIVALDDDLDAISTYVHENGGGALAPLSLKFAGKG